VLGGAVLSPRSVGVEGSVFFSSFGAEGGGGVIGLTTPANDFVFFAILMTVK